MNSHERLLRILCACKRPVSVNELRQEAYEQTARNWALATLPIILEELRQFGFAQKASGKWKVTNKGRVEIVAKDKGYEAD